MWKPNGGEPRSHLRRQEGFLGDDLQQAQTKKKCVSRRWWSHDGDRCGGQKSGQEHARMRRTNGSPRGARPRGPGGRTLLGHRPPDRSGSSRRRLLPAPIPTRTPAARSPRRRDPSAYADPISPGSKRPAAAIVPPRTEEGNRLADWVRCNRRRGRGRLKNRGAEAGASRREGETAAVKLAREEKRRGGGGAGVAGVGVAGIGEGCADVMRRTVIHVRK